MWEELSPSRRGRRARITCAGMLRTNTGLRSNDSPARTRLTRKASRPDSGDSFSTVAELPAVRCPVFHAHLDLSCCPPCCRFARSLRAPRSEEHTSELQSLTNLVCRLLLEK